MDLVTLFGTVDTRTVTTLKLIRTTRQQSCTGHSYTNKKTHFSFMFEIIATKKMQREREPLAQTGLLETTKATNFCIESLHKISNTEELQTLSQFIQILFGVAKKKKTTT